MTSTLFVVIDPTTIEQIALKRAEQIAVDMNARLHLFCCDYSEDLSEFGSRREAKTVVIRETEQLLEELAAPLRREGLVVTTEAYWNSDWQESVVHAAERLGADLILKSSSPHTLMERHLKRTSDLVLLRKACCAVLLVNDPDPWTGQRLLAAITLDSDDPAHDLLNNAIMTEATRLAEATQSDLHCVTALEQKGDLVDVLKLLEDREPESPQQKIGQLYGLIPERVHICRGPAKNAILDVAEELRVDVVVLGTVARKGVKALLLGNTAEKVLDRLECDILVVN